VTGKITAPVIQKKNKERVNLFLDDVFAWQAAQKQLARWQPLDALTFRKKLNGHLARRGFSYDIIQAITVRAGIDKD